MKTNNKRRKLAYIREKNLIRKGLTMYGTYKISNLLENYPEEYFQESLANLTAIRKSLEKKWKLKFKFVGTTTGFIGLDYALDMHSVMGLFRVTWT